MIIFFYGNANIGIILELRKKKTQYIQNVIAGLTRNLLVEKESSPYAGDCGSLSAMTLKESE